MSRSQGKLENARPLMQRAYNIADKALGTDHRTTSTIGQHLALLQLQLLMQARRKSSSTLLTHNLYPATAKVSVANKDTCSAHTRCTACNLAGSAERLIVFSTHDTGYVRWIGLCRSFGTATSIYEWRRPALSSCRRMFNL